MVKKNNFSENLEDFITELKKFEKNAEVILESIEKDLEGNRFLFSEFYENMFTIKGTALQLSLPQISHIATLGEEIAHKALKAEKKGQIRRCVQSLWDALTTIKYCLENIEKETFEEQDILVQRLEKTLLVLGGPRPHLTQEQIRSLLENPNYLKRKVIPSQ